MEVGRSEMMRRRSRTRANSESESVDLDTRHFELSDYANKSDKSLRRRFDSQLKDIRKKKSNASSRSRSRSLTSDTLEGVTSLNISEDSDASAGSPRAAETEFHAEQSPRSKIDDKRCDYVLELGGCGGAATLRKGCRSDRKPLLQSVPMGFYLGVMTMSRAEKKVSKPCTFALYHPIARPENITFSITSTLQMVYRNSRGHCRHYPIEKCGVGYCIIGAADSPCFRSIEGLVKYYRTYALVSEDQEGQTNVDLLVDPTPILPLNFQWSD